MPAGGDDRLGAARITASAQQRDRTTALCDFVVRLLLAGQRPSQPDPLPSCDSAQSRSSLRDWISNPAAVFIRGTGACGTARAAALNRGGFSAAKGCQGRGCDFPAFLGRQSEIYKTQTNPRETLERACSACMIARLADAGAIHAQVHQALLLRLSRRPWGDRAPGAVNRRCAFRRRACEGRRLANAQAVDAVRRVARVGG